jgi:hypothetical protein
VQEAKKLEILTNLIQSKENLTIKRHDSSKINIIIRNNCVYQISIYDSRNEYIVINKRHVTIHHKKVKVKHFIPFKRKMSKILEKIHVSIKSEINSQIQKY